MLLLHPHLVAATPLSRPEVVKLVQKKVHERRLLAVVRELGLDFKLTPEALEELRRAGASPSLLQALQQFAAGDEPRLGTSPPPATPTVTAPPAESPQPAPPAGSEAPTGEGSRAEAPASLPTLAAPTTGDVPGPSMNAEPPPPGAPAAVPPPPEPPSRWEQVKPLLDKALALASESEYRGAQALLAKAMEIDPGEPQVWKAFKEIEQDLLTRAETFLADGQLPRALREFQFVIRTNPESARGQNGVGLVLMQLKNYEEAAQAFDRALALDPGNARYRQGLNDARRLQKAAKALEEKGKETVKGMVNEQPGTKR
jgi:tetratricopeptide (TPR) repeat protein